MTPSKSVAIVGGGISGLAAAWQLRVLRSDVRIVLFESSQKLGGVLQTETCNGYLIENSADMFTTDPADALVLCDQLGRSDDLITTQAVAQRACIATPTGILPVPNGFSLLLPNDLAAVTHSALLDSVGVARFLDERLIPARLDASDESLAAFAVRRFGHQVFDRIIQPLVSGIYTADPQQLSMQATMARFLELEQKYGSLIAAAEAEKKSRGTFAAQQSGSGSVRRDRPANADENASGARYDLFRAPPRGMSQLVDWIIAALVNVEIKLGVSVAALEKTSLDWRLQLEAVSAESRLSLTDLPPEFAGVICATPARSTASLLRNVDTELARRLENIAAASCAVVVVGFDQKQLASPFSGFGIVVPSYLNRQLMAASFASNKFTGRAPAGKVLIRVFIGGALQGHLVDLPDEQLLRIALSELNPWLKISGSPELSRVIRWREAMPQYQLGHLQRIEQISAGIQQHPGLEVAGNSYNGVGIPACIASGRRAAERMNAYLSDRPPKSL